MSDPKKYLSKIVKGQDTLWIKDSEAQASIEDLYSKISGGMHYLGVSSTEIEDGDDVGPWVIDGVTYVASGATGSQKNLSAGDIAIYGELEFIWSGASGKWQEFGSTGSLGALAFKDSASATYTPAGQNAASAVSFTGQTDGDFVTGYNNDGVAPSFTEGAFTPASLGTGFYSAGTAPSFSEGAFSTGSLPSFTEGAYTPASLGEGFYTVGTAPSLGNATTGSFVTGYNNDAVAPSLGAATTGNFNTDAEKSSYDETNECLTLSAASTSAAVTAQGTFSAGSAATLATASAVTAQGTFSAGSVTTLDLTKFSGGSKAADSFDAGSLPSKAADTWSAGTMTSIDVTKFNGGSKAADSFSAGSAATLATGKAITAVGTGEAAAQTFTGTQATITVS